MLKENLIQLFQESFKEHWDLPALSDYSTKETVSYGELARKIARLHVFYRACGIKKGDKVALMGKNNIDWVNVFVGTICYGAVIVPILNEFNPQDAQHIINHSDAKLLFVAGSTWESMEFSRLTNLIGVLTLDKKHSLLAWRGKKNVHEIYTNLNSLFDQTYPDGFVAANIKYAKIPNDSLCEINYTSGTTGFSKGVMLTVNNLTGNVVFGISENVHFRGSRCLSFLPMAHAYGCAFDLLTPLAVGSHITVLGKVPSPKIIMAAMAAVRPDLVICVPLVLEKIYRKQIQPLIEKKYIRWAMQIPFLDSKIFSTIRNKLIAAFGGHFSEIIIGGAPLNAEVEDFLRKIKFPFTVGYGMTECAPLISYTYWKDFVPHSAGRILKGYMEVHIDSDDPQNTPGEICVRGEHVMVGYYKNEEATKSVIDEEGWLHTGDMGVVSKDGTISIRGRSKTMILSANGQNIYPEEIESKLNNMPFVSESLVLDREGKVVAIVYPDYEAMDAISLTLDNLPAELDKVRKELNKLVAPYEQVTKIEILPNGFTKTPKHSIKRYLYH